MEEDKFLDFVHECAKKIGKEFLMDTGEGRCIDFDGMECEDLSGWLIDPKRHDALVATPYNERYDGEFGDCYVFALWRIEDGKMTIEFKNADDYF